MEEFTGSMQVERCIRADAQGGVDGCRRENGKGPSFFWCMTSTSEAYGSIPRS